MDLEGIMLRAISQTEKDKCHDFTYMWNLKNKTKKQNRNRLIEQKTSEQKTYTD